MMSKLSKRVDELDKVVRKLCERSEIELYAGDKITEWVSYDGDSYPNIKFVNKRQTTVKAVLLSLLERLDIDLEDIPPEKARFQLIDAPEEEDDD
jgi:hypothetical protein